MWADIKVIQGYEGKYLVSREGRVYRREKGKRIAPQLKQSPRRGYPRVQLDGKDYSVHRLVAEAFIPNPHNYPVVKHLDHDKTNAHASNLMWDTQQQNAEDSFAVEYCIVNPEGDIVQGNNIRKLCRDFGLHSYAVQCVMTGMRKSHKGWTRAGGDPSGQQPQF